jgi:hypothetical protein
MLGIMAAAAAGGAAYAQPTAPLAPPPPAAAPAPPPPPAPAPPPAPPTPPAPPAPAAPAAPAAAIGPYLNQAIEKVCIPLIQGQKINDVAKANGLRHFHDDWLLQGPGVERVIISLPTVANPTICNMTVDYELGQTLGIVTVLGNWAASQNPPLDVLESGSAVGPGVTGWTWAVDTSSGGHTGVVFDHQTSPDGKPLGRGFDVGTLMFSYKAG